jgi:hypothetical protein
VYLCFSCSSIEEYIVQEREKWNLNAKRQSSPTCANHKHTFYVSLCFVCELLDVGAHKLNIIHTVHKDSIDISLIELADKVEILTNIKLYMYNNKNDVFLQRKS